MWINHKEVFTLYNGNAIFISDMDCIDINENGHTRNSFVTITPGKLALQMTCTCLNYTKKVSLNFNVSQTGAGVSYWSARFRKLPGVGRLLRGNDHWGLGQRGLQRCSVKRRYIYSQVSLTFRLEFECFWIITARKRSLGQGNVFTPVCQSFCSRGGGVSQHTMRQTPSHPDTPPRQTPPLSRTLLGRHPLGRHPQRQTPSPDTMGYGLQVDGTHGTGMHTCIYHECLVSHNRKWYMEQFCQWSIFAQNLRFFLVYTKFIFSVVLTKK